MALEIGNKFEQLVCEQDGDGMTGLQLLSCNPGAFQRDDGRGLLEQIVNTGWYYQSLSCYCIRVNSCISFLNACVHSACLKPFFYGPG